MGNFACFPRSIAWMLCALVKIPFGRCLNTFIEAQTLDLIFWVFSDFFWEIVRILREIFSDLFPTFEASVETLQTPQQRRKDKKTKIRKGKKTTKSPVDAYSNICVSKNAVC